MGDRFRGLEAYRGDALRHFYEHTRRVDNDFAREQKEAIRHYRSGGLAPRRTKGNVTIDEPAEPDPLRDLIVGVLGTV